MNTLDSRYLNVTNCFSYRFATAGIFRYDVSPLALAIGEDDDDDEALRIVVADQEDMKRQQHYVTVSRAEGALTAKPAQLQIARGDVVTWSTDGSVGVGFAVRGRIGRTAVDSAAMRDDSVFTHAFGLPGEYAWADANGSRLRGVVRVVQPQLDGKAAAEHRSQWQRALGKGTMVHIRGDAAEPAEVEIMVGQTVFWVVQDSPGVSITDATLLT